MSGPLLIKLKVGCWQSFGNVWNGLWKLEFNSVLKSGLILENILAGRKNPVNLEEIAANHQSDLSDTIGSKMVREVGFEPTNP
jgi:hypothetical protein